MWGGGSLRVGELHITSRDMTWTRYGIWQKSVVIIDAMKSVEDFGLDHSSFSRVSLSVGESEVGSSQGAQAYLPYPSCISSDSSRVDAIAVREDISTNEMGSRLGQVTFGHVLFKGDLDF